MPIDGYTTKVPVSRTVGEIQTLLAQAGADRIMIEYEQGNAKGVSFLLKTPGGDLAFRLPSRPKGVYSVMVDDPKVPQKLKTWEQASRVAWRNIKKWVEAQLAFIEADQATLPELFLPFGITTDGGTVYEKYMGDRLALEEGRNDD